MAAPALWAEEQVPTIGLYGCATAGFGFV
jgi:hypothetical protein